MKENIAMTDKLDNINEQENIAEKPDAKPLDQIQDEQQDTEKKPIRWVQIRLLPIWLRILIVLILICLAAIIGVMVGYGVIGDGKASDALKADTWRHIFDIVNGRE